MGLSPSSVSTRRRTWAVAPKPLTYHVYGYGSMKHSGKRTLSLRWVHDGFYDRKVSSDFLQILGRLRRWGQDVPQKRGGGGEWRRVAKPKDVQACAVALLVGLLGIRCKVCKRSTQAETPHTCSGVSSTGCHQ